MNPLADAWRALGMAGKAIAVALAGLILLGLWWVILGRPAHEHRMAVEAKAAQAMSDARAASGAIAAKAVGDNAAADAKTNQIQRENSDAIDQASDAKTAVPDTADALRRGLCRYAAYAHEPQCKAR